MIRSLFFCVLLFCCAAEVVQTQTGTPASAVRIGRVKYAGGGDWYNDPSAEVNLLAFVRQHAGIDVDPTYTPVDIGSEQIFSFPILFMTGHGNIALTGKDLENLRTYLQNGGFLYADDDYGMDAAFRREMARVFPNSQLVELGFDHPIYHQVYDFSSGLPKIHEHDEGPPHGYGIFVGGRMVVFYTFNTNISDGWTAAHKDPPDVREQAFRVGVNIVSYFCAN